MGALFAIIADTWRQSRQQVVFLIMLGLLAVTVLVAVGFTHTVELVQEDGTRVEHVALAGIDDDGQFLTQAWSGLYMSTIALDSLDSLGDGDGVDPFSEEGQQLQQELMDAAIRADQISAKRRGGEVVIYGVSFAIYTISMLMFIAACAGYFPALLEAGAIDIVLAKPLERWKVFLGKYLGGLALFATALFGAYLLLFVGLGLRTGVWHLAVFRVMPLQLLSAASLFALIGLLGVARGSTALAMIVGYVYYLVVDKILQGLMILPFQSESWRSAQKLLRATIPNFVAVRNVALNSIINVRATDWQPILVMLVWTGVGLGVGYWVFWRRDY